MGNGSIIQAGARWVAAIGILQAGLWGQAYKSTVAGTFQAPDGTPFTGTITISLAKKPGFLVDFIGVTGCSVPVGIQVPMALRVKITAGVFSQVLFANKCFLPKLYYDVRVFDKNNKQLYFAQWNVPGGGGTEDPGVVDLKIAGVKF
jgi:hypothetical protein